MSEITSSNLESVGAKKVRRKVAGTPNSIKKQTGRISKRRVKYHGKKS
jgi:hypothetical protein